MEKLKRAKVGPEGRLAKLDYLQAAMRLLRRSKELSYTTVKERSQGILRIHRGRGTNVRGPCSNLHRFDQEEFTESNLLDGPM